MPQRRFRKTTSWITNEQLGFLNSPREKPAEDTAVCARRRLLSVHPPFADPQAQCFDIHLLFQAVQNLVADRVLIP